MKTFAHLLTILICSGAILVAPPTASLAKNPLAAGSESVEVYYPPSESAAGWRRCNNDEEVRKLAGFDPKLLDSVGLLQRQRSYGGAWATVIVRNGYLVREWYQAAEPQESFRVMSCTKSATGIAYGMLLEDSRNHRLPHGAQIDLESPAYASIPEGYPLTDPRKERIKLRHLLTMTSGIPGEDHGLQGLAVAPGGGEYEIALGREVNIFGGSAAKLYAEPGESWEYSDAAFVHLSLIFARVAGKEISNYMRERVFRPIGVENFGWDWEGGAGHIGPHDDVQGGLHITARDFARLGYLMVREGAWKGQQIVPKWWINLATKSSQQFNPSYGYTFWVNSDGVLWPRVPKDAFAFMGYASNRCYVVPSLNLVVVRLGFSPPAWEEGELLPRVVRAITQ